MTRLSQLMGVLAEKHADRVTDLRLVRGNDFVAYERAATVRGDEFRRKVRIACRAFNCHRLLWPKIARLDGLSVYKYLSHKYLRWLAGYFLVVGAAASAMIVLGAKGLAT